MPTQTMFAGQDGVADTFSFSRQQGRNTVNDFDADQDVLNLRGFGRHEIRIVQEYLEDGTPVAHIHAGGFAGFGKNHTEVSLIGVELSDLQGRIAANGDILFA